MSASESSSIAAGLPQHRNTSANRPTAAAPPAPTSPAAIGFPSASANLYHLHAALAALLPGKNDSSVGDTSQPLALASLRHSRAFLLDLKRQADGAAGSGSSSSAVVAVGTSRSGLWQTEQGRTASQSAPVPSRRHREEARALGDSLDALPAHWKLHNAFCSRCVGVVIPGITASSLVGVGKGKQREVEPQVVAQRATARSVAKQNTRKRKSGSPGSSDGPPLVCLLCQTRDSPDTVSSKRRKNRHLPHSDGSLALKGYAPLTVEEQLAKKASLRKFPSVRRRDAGKEAGAAKQERSPPSAVEALKPDMDKLKATSSSDPSVTKTVNGGTPKAGEADSTPKTSLQPVVAAPDKTLPLASPKPRKQPVQDDTSSSSPPSSSLSVSKAIPSTSKSSTKTTAASPAPTAPPSLPVQAGQGSNKKKDHKAALRAMLAKGDTAGKKGSKDKKAAEGSASGGGSAGGGGLRDFLAGL